MPRANPNRLHAPTLVHGAVTVRPHLESDVPRMVETARDEITQHWLTYLPVDYGESNARALLAAAAEDRVNGVALRLAIADPETDAFLGHVSLIHVQVGCQGEVAFWLHPDARGRGLATTAARLVMTYGFDNLGLERIVAHVHATNGASRRVLEGLGMRLVKLDPDAAPIRDGTRDDRAEYELTNRPTPR